MIILRLENSTFRATTFHTKAEAPHRRAWLKNEHVGQQVNWFAIYSFACRDM